MKWQSKGSVLGAAALTLSLWSVAAAQTGADKTLMVEDVFKNVQVLKGISVVEFMDTMGFFSASLGYNCTNCHTMESLGDWAKYADDIPAKRTARRMVQMVNAINQENFGGRHVVTCFTCHRGDGLPKGTPSLLAQYSAPPPEDPNEIAISPQTLKGPSAEEVLDKYLQAAGGEGKLAALKSLRAKGMYGGFDTDFSKVPVEVYAKAPGQRTVVAHTPLGDNTTTFDGRAGWYASPDRPAPLLAVPAGPDLDGLRLDAELMFPAGIKQALANWRAGFSSTSINGREVVTLQGSTPTGMRVKLFFDKQNGLLARSVRFANSVVGVNPTQVDYADYREVAGVKIPFKWTVTWTDGQSSIELTDVEPNAAIDAARFARPAPAKKI
ncbi:MAG TPA: photosynthetic reaction center cytochrome c subunit family protein [Bryobacteraceae bacterium]|nr:photosynthetic reaction center cytochrome c subunit family protein [Bryobacteraceae bacterium]